MNLTPEKETLEDLQRLLDEAGATIVASWPIDHGVQCTIARGPDRATVNIYRTGKVSTGGKASTLRALLDGWRLSRSGKDGGGVSGAAGGSRADARSGARSGAGPALDGTPRVGIDEAGKGDYFGPLVVAGARVLDRQAAEKLREAGVRDSKLLGVHGVRAVARRVLEALGPENVRVVVLGPRQYEARRAAAGENVNRLLGEINAEIIEQLEAEVELFVVDEFAKAARSYIEPGLRPGLGPGVRLEVRPRAEDDAAVAAASVLARARYLEELERLSGRVGFELPRGATHVFDAARRVVEELGPEGLAEVAKVHFATTQRVPGAKDRWNGGGGS